MTNQVCMEEGQVLDNAENDRIGEDDGIERKDGEDR